MAWSGEERRVQRRLNQRHSIAFGPHRIEHLGFVKNLALDGLALTSKVIFKPSATLLLRITSPTPIDLEAEVRWSSHHQAPRDFEAVMTMGLSLTKRDDDYLSFIQNLIERSKGPRTEPRFEKLFRVAYESPRELLDEYTQNISAGGMFIMTHTPPELNSFIEVNLLIVDIMRVIHVEGRVVYTLSPEIAAASGRKPGVGVQFTRFFGDDEQVFARYIDELKSQAND